MKEPFKLLDDSTIIDSEGRIGFFGVDRFIKDIATGECCFICGASPKEKEFNDEHIIPEWILRRFALFERQVTLPNGRSIPYSQYTVPCCYECNFMLGERIENPISQIISRGYNGVAKYIREHGPWIFFKWLSLIYLKTHLKDKQYRFFVDQRDPEVKISEFYDWESIHHIHCVARSLYTNCSIHPEVIGSFYVVPAICDADKEQFDYGDNLPGKGILIRLGEIVFISILNDSGASLNLFKEEMERIKGPLSVLQYREILAHLSFLNFNLVHRPQYCSEVNEDRSIEIKAFLPEMFEFKNSHEFEFGDFLAHGCVGIINGSDHPEKEEIIKKVKEGHYTFLFDENRDFIQN